MTPSWEYPPQKRPDPGGYEPWRRLRHQSATSRKSLNRNSTRRETEAGVWMVQSSSSALTRSLRLAVVVLGIGLVMTAGAARAQDDEDDGKTFEEKIIEGIMAGVGGTNMENRGIDYRERSPLGVPPRIDLPPPEAAVKGEVKAANWPKDPDEAKRKAAIAARKKSKPDPIEASRILTPSELNAARTAPPTRTSNDPIQPGDSSLSPVLSPSQLGFDGRFTNLFGGNKSEIAPFKGEPTRDSL